MYTKRERTERKYPLNKAFENAKAQLPGRSICVNAISGRSYAELITLQEVNELAQQMIDDTIYYDGL